MLDAYPYDVICFNNGLHSLSTDRTEWDAAYRAAVAFIRAKLPDTKLSLTLSTPLMVREVAWAGAEAYAVAGTPARAIAARDIARTGYTLKYRTTRFHAEAYPALPLLFSLRSQALLLLSL